MKVRDIEKIIARHLLQEGSLDGFLNTDDRRPETLDMLDALVQQKNRRIMDDLSPLATVHPQEIYEAFKTFGLYETSTYLQTLGGQHRLHNIKTVYMAALKLGNPELSWAEIAARTAQAAPLDIKNPQMVMRGAFEKRMNAAIHSLGEGTGSADDLPLTNDRLYLNSILISHCDLHYKVEAVDISGCLIGGVLDLCDSGAALTTEDECREAGRMALACQSLPDANAWDSDFYDRPVMEHLERARVACEKRAAYFGEYEDLVAEEQQRLARLDQLIERVRPYADAGHALFTHPVDAAIRIYNYNLARKIHEILGDEAPHIADRATSARLPGLTP